MTSRPRHNAARTTAIREPLALVPKNLKITDSKEVPPDPSTRMIPLVELHKPIVTVAALTSKLD